MPQAVPRKSILQVSAAPDLKLRPRHSSHLPCHGRVWMCWKLVDLEKGSRITRPDAGHRHLEVIRHIISGQGKLISFLRVSLPNPIASVGSSYSPSRYPCICRQQRAPRTRALGDCPMSISTMPLRILNLNACPSRSPCGISKYPST